MKPFEYTRSATVSEAIELLEGDDVRPLAGGTDLLTLMKADVTSHRQLVDVKRTEGLPAGIQEDEQGLTIGALTTLTQIEQSTLLQERHSVLAQAASVAATPQLRNRATLGGNLLQRPRCWYFRNSLFHCWLKGGEECPARDGQNQFHAIFDKSTCCAVHPSDLAPALVALDAWVRLQGPQGERTMLLADFYAPPTDERRTETVIRDDELLLSVHIPSSPSAVQSTYLKAMDRKVWSFALVGVAAVMGVVDGKIDHARLVLSGVSPVPHHAAAAEEQLEGERPSDALFARVAEMALAAAEPLAENGYKISLLRRLIPRALKEVAQSAGA